MSTFKAGILAITVLVLLAYFGFTKANPFANPYELKAMFRDVESLKPRSPVRIAGVEVGKVTKVEPKDGEKLIAAPPRATSKTIAETKNCTSEEDESTDNALSSRLTICSYSCMCRSMASR